MYADDEKGRWERLLDALLMMTLPGDLAADLPLPEDAARLLTLKGRRALETLGPDVVTRVMRGGVYRKPRRRRQWRQGCDRPGGSFRCGGTGILTDQARAEMDRRVRELEAREREAAAAVRGAKRFA
jgi:hypothetical protein